MTEGEADEVLDASEAVVRTVGHLQPHQAGCACAIALGRIAGAMGLELDNFIKLTETTAEAEPLA